MIPQRVNIAHYDNIIADLKVNNIPFKLYTTTFTKRLECILGTFFYSERSGIKLSEMYFINKVKKHCEKLEGIEIVKQSQIKYIDRNIYKDTVIKKEIYEIDLSQAYWNFALMCGYITKELYDEGMTLSKQMRLVCLGALAKQVMFLNYNGYEFDKVEREPILPTANIFFKVSLLTDMAIKEAYRIAGKNGGLFYWVDAIFIRGKENFKNVQTFFNSENLPFKYYKLDKVTFNGSNVKIYSKDWAEKHNTDKEYRLFNFDK